MLGIITLWIRNFLLFSFLQVCFCCRMSALRLIPLSYPRRILFFFAPIGNQNGKQAKVVTHPSGKRTPADLHLTSSAIRDPRRLRHAFFLLSLPNNRRDTWPLFQSWVTPLGPFIFWFHPVCKAAHSVSLSLWWMTRGSQDTDFSSSEEY